MRHNNNGCNNIYMTVTKIITQNASGFLWFIKKRLDYVGNVTRCTYIHNAACVEQPLHTLQA